MITLKHKFWTSIFGVILLTIIILAIFTIKRTNTIAKKANEQETEITTYIEPTWQTTYPTGTCYTIVDLNMRLQPDITGQFHSAIPYGTKLDVNHINNDWAYLPHYGTYVYAGYLAKKQPSVYFSITTDTLRAAKYAGQIIDLITDLSKPIQNIVKQYTIELVSEPIKKTNSTNNGITLGYTTITENGQKKTIKIFTNDNYLKYTVYHEIGHILDYWYANHHNDMYFSETKEIKDSFKKESDKIYTLIDSLRKTMITDDKELFAECYRIFLTNPQDFENAAPATFTYIQKFITNINNQKY